MKVSVISLALLVWLVIACNRRDVQSSYEGATNGNPSSVAAAPAPAELTGGTDVGSGGDFKPAGKEAVRNAVSELKPKVKLAFHRLSDVDDLSGHEPVKKILEAALDPDHFRKDQTRVYLTLKGRMADDIDRAKYLDSADPTCPPKPNGHKAAWTRMGGLDSPICFDVDVLAQIPAEALEAQLVALAAHEHAHHFGFEETDARYLQNFMLGEGKWYINPNALWTSFAQPIHRLGDLTNELRSGLESKSVGEICSELGQIRELVRQLNTYTAVSWSRFEHYGIKLTNYEITSVGFRNQIAMSASTYCTSAPKELNTNGFPPVENSNKKMLLKRLDEILEGVRFFRDILKKSAGTSVKD